MKNIAPFIQTLTTDEEEEETEYKPRPLKVSVFRRFFCCATGSGQRQNPLVNDGQISLVATQEKMFVMICHLLFIASPIFQPSCSFIYVDYAALPQCIPKRSSEAPRDASTTHWAPCKEMLSSRS
jgi:hypothetical protein